MKGDFTRSTFKKEKYYSSVRMQQGRVQIDADWNEQMDIQAYLNRTEAIDVIGRTGVPIHKSGFNVTPNDGDLAISPGRIYVNGILCELDESGVTYFTQPDFPEAPGVGDGDYLVYLDVWERHITALDDQEIRERALGGPDTATRTKIIWQVKLQPTTNQDCDQVDADWQPEDAKSSGQLSARAQPGAAADDPCLIPAGAGYRRLENQLYRVEVHDGGALGHATFKWSRDNGSIVARVENIENTNEVKITVNYPVLARLKEFSAGQWIEVADDAHELRGQPGTLVRISNVKGNEITVDTTTATGPLTLIDFPLNQNPKVSRWDSDGLVRPTVNDGFILLEDGVEVKFEAGDYKTGDYWLIPARSATGDIEWPKEGQDPKLESPHGINHHYCPLALVEYSNSQFRNVRDCRKIFPPLTEIEIGGGTTTPTCCTITVGDGTNSVGDVNDIQAAIGQIPSSGGDICLLPGVHEANVHISQDNIRIKGCGLKTKVISQANASDPIFSLEDTENIIIEDIFIEARDVSVPSIRITENTPGESKEIEIKNNHIEAFKNAICIEGGSNIRIVDNKIHMHDEDGGETAIYMLAEHSIIKNNVILVEERQGEPFITPGGIQIAGSSENVKVIENQITGGSGNGITLGSIPTEGTSESDIKTTKLRVVITVTGLLPGTGFNLTLTRKGGKPIKIQNITPMKPPDFKFYIEKVPVGEYELSISSSALIGGDIKFYIKEIKVYPGFSVDPTTYPTTPGESFTFTIEATEQETPGGFIDGILVENNEISNMGLSGIGALWFINDPASDPSSYLSTLVENLAIRQNQIFNCLQNPNRISDVFVGPRAPNVEDEIKKRGFGGISLGTCENLSIFGNRIENNGTTLIDPDGTTHINPVCGIYVHQGGPVDISHNIIVNAGLFINQEYSALGRGKRGGIVMKTNSLYSPGENQISIGGAAARVHDNVVDILVGPALGIESVGPLSLVNNRFNSELYTVVSVVATEFNISDSLQIRGDILFCNNQTRLGPENESAISQLIRSDDDVSFHNNQSEYWSIKIQYPECFNTHIEADTIRASGNRFSDRIMGVGVISLFTKAGALNNTVNNQGDHCIVAICEYPNKPAVDQGNQVLIDQNCEKLKEEIEGYLKGVTTKYGILKEFKGDPIDIKKDFRDIQKGLRPLLENENKRLIKKYGKDHPRTKKIQAKLKHNINTLHNLDVELQIAKIKVPEVEKKDLLINGRVTDEKLLGISNFMVYLTDSRKRKITTIKGTKTDTSGYYAFVITPETAKTISKKKVYLTVYNEKGKILHQRDKPLEITEGGRESIDVALDRAAITPPEKKKKKPAKKEKEKKEIKKTKEKIPPKAKPVKTLKLEDIKGIGSAAAKKLRDAGIKDVKTFSETDEAKLKEVLGKVDIGKLKKESISLLEKQKKDISAKAKE